MAKPLLQLDTVLLTARTVVRRFREEEGQAFWEMLQNNQSDIRDNLAPMLELVKGPEDAELFVRREMAFWLTQKQYSFAIWKKETVEMVGYIGLHELDWHLPGARLRFFLDRHVRGKGIMNEVMNAVIPFAFNQLKMERIWLKIGMDNFSAQRVVRRANFHREGDLRHAIRTPTGILMDAMQFALTRPEFERL